MPISTISVPVNGTNMNWVQFIGAGAIGYYFACHASWPYNMFPNTDPNLVTAGLAVGVGALTWSSYRSVAYGFAAGAALGTFYSIS
jgi:hypothetical protein